jgi:hypothetical protein
MSTTFVRSDGRWRAIACVRLGMEATRRSSSEALSGNKAIYQDEHRAQNSNCGFRVHAELREADRSEHDTDQ